jgi:hypothetical protein
VKKDERRRRKCEVIRYLIVFGDGDDKQHGGDVIEAVNPLLSFVTLLRRREGERQASKQRSGGGNIQNRRKDKQTRIERNTERRPT